MSGQLREERGFTLMEVLVVCVLMIVVLGATLTAFASFQRNNDVNNRQNDAQDQARTALDDLARALRNLASPTNEQPEAVERAEPQDLVFLTIGNTKPGGSQNAYNTRRVRYCLDGDGHLWRQQQSWTTDTAPDVPAARSCPGAGWDKRRAVADHVVNGAREVFDYNATELTAITQIGMTLYVDVNPGRSPKETGIQSAVFLRNQNRAPTASFTASPSGSSIVLNGSQSEDPEGRALEYYWYDEGVSSSDICKGLPPEVPAAGCVGAGIVMTYTPPAAGKRTVYLIVRDPAGLTNQAPSQTVCVGTGVCE